jgi:hypothetical protein
LATHVYLHRSPRYSIEKGNRNRKGIEKEEKKDRTKQPEQRKPPEPAQLTA